jgi:hypothetical protein
MGKYKVSMWLVCIGFLLSVGVVATQAGLEEGLVSYYKLDDGSGTVATDASGNGHDGTLIQPELVWVPGYDGGALGCPGADIASRLEFPTTGMSATAGTVALFAYLSDPQPTQTRYFFGHTAQPQFNSRIQIYMDSGTTLDIGIGDAHAKAADITALNVKTWYHIVLTWANGSYVVYVDGKEINKGTYTGLTSLNTIANIANDGSSAPYEALGGVVDEVRLYNRAVTADEVQQMSQMPQATLIKAWAPSPANGDMSVTVGTLEWKSLDTIPSHNVYMGTDPNLTAADLIGSAVPVCMFFYIPGLQPGVTYYWRVDEIESDGVTVHPGDVWTFTAQALTAYGPNPADGAIDASPAPTLTWQAGQDAVKHHVYFGTSQEAVAKGDKTTDKGTVDQPLFKPGELQEARTYYWRVDEILASGAVRTGPVWSFRTYVRVDDFEKYTDDEGSRIFETWVDGVTNGTGSQVGYWEAPFAEQKIVHGGKQSMPFAYNNVKTPYYSEAEQEFPSAEGGGSYDIDTLVLWVRGQATNSPATLYVGLKDVHGQVGVVTNLDPTVVTTSKWTEWQIFMPQFMATGVDLMAVKKIMIGVGDRQNPAQGGTGLIFLDDIHAIKTMTFDPSQMMMP